MDFKIFRLSEELVFIRWHHNPSPVSEDTFLFDLDMLLEEARVPLFFIVDTSAGHLADPFTLCRLTELAEHPQWGGSACYSTRMPHPAHIASFDRSGAFGCDERLLLNVDEALDYLDCLNPGMIARSIDRQVLEILYG